MMLNSLAHGNEHAEPGQSMEEQVQEQQDLESFPVHPEGCFWLAPSRTWKHVGGALMMTGEEKRRGKNNVKAAL